MNKIWSENTWLMSLDVQTLFHKETQTMFSKKQAKSLCMFTQSKFVNPINEKGGSDFDILIFLNFDQKKKVREGLKN